MNNCKTLNDYRLIIIDLCQDCEFLSYCMYDICISKLSQSDYLSISLSLDYCERGDIL